MSPGATMPHHYLSQVSNNSFDQVFAFSHFLDALTGTKTPAFNWLSCLCKDRQCLIVKIRMWKWYLHPFRGWCHKQMLSVSGHSPKATSWANKQRLILKLIVPSLPLSPTKSLPRERPQLGPLSSACITWKKKKRTCGRCPRVAARTLGLCAVTLCISATATANSSSTVSGNWREFQWIRAQTVV